MSFSSEASETAAIIKEVSSDALEAMKPLADELGMAAKYVFELFVLQNYVQVAQSIFWVITLIAISIFLFKWQKSTRNHEDFEWSDYEAPTFAGVGVFLARVVVIILVITSLSIVSSSIIPRTLNPHYYVIKDMVTTGQTLINK